MIILKSFHGLHSKRAQAPPLSGISKLDLAAVVICISTNAAAFQHVKQGSCFVADRYKPSPSKKGSRAKLFRSTVDSPRRLRCSRARKRVRVFFCNAESTSGVANTV